MIPVTTSDFKKTCIDKITISTALGFNLMPLSANVKEDAKRGNIADASSNLGRDPFDIVNPPAFGGIRNLRKFHRRKQLS